MTAVIPHFGSNGDKDEELTLKLFYFLSFYTMEEQKRNGISFVEPQLNIEPFKFATIEDLTEAFVSGAIPYEVLDLDERAATIINHLWEVSRYSVECKDMELQFHIQEAAHRYIKAIAERNNNF